MTRPLNGISARRSRVGASAAASLPLCLVAALAGGAGLALAADDSRQDDDADEAPSIYPELPDAPPPATEVEGSSAETAEEMQPYSEVLTGTELTFDLVPIPGGTFLMGSPEDEADRKAYEGPQVEVTVSPFWMARTETTWDLYQQFMDSLDKAARARGTGEAAPQDTWADAVSRPTPPYVPMDFGMGTDGFPAICMTQFAAKQYTKWLSMKTGRFYRLPTEAEWEYACRAGTTGPFSFPADDVNEYGIWFDNSDGQYQPVGSLKPNAFGLYDMHGNVLEWCFDAFSEDGYADFAKLAAEGPLVDPVRWPEGLYPRVARGGHWDDDPDALRSAARRPSNESWKMQDPQLPKSIWYHTDAEWLGFRVVRPLDPPPFEEWGRWHDADVEKVVLIQERQRRGER